MADRFSTLDIKRVAEYWNNRPCNIRHSPAPVGTKQYFDEVEARKYFVEPHIPLFAEFDRWHGKRVLEIGCGIGTDTINFARAGAQVMAIDLSNKSLDLARQRANVFGLENSITFCQANAEHLSSIVPPEPYDLIYSFGVIHHTPSPERVIEQIQNHYVHPGSLVKIMVYHWYSWKLLWVFLKHGKGRFWRLKDIIRENSEAQFGSPVTYTYTRREGRELVESAGGLKVTDVFVEHIFPYRISDYREYRYVKEWYWRWMPRPMFRWMERHFGWHMCIAAEMRRESSSTDEENPA